MKDSRLFETPGPDLMEAAMAGIIATAPMTAAMVLIHRLLPPLQRYPLEPYRITRRVARRLGLGGVLDDKGKQVAATAVAHFGYGAAAGAIFPALLGWLPVSAVLAGMVYGLAVWIASYLGLMPALSILRPATKHPSHRNLLMIVAHLVWGAALGWLLEQGDGD
jgi:hypothetical protein